MLDKAIAIMKVMHRALKALEIPRRIRARSLGLAALAMIVSTTAWSTVHCAGPVVDVGIGVGGAVNVQLSGGTGVAFNAICSVSIQGSYQVDPTTCKAVYAMLLAAKLSGDSAGIYYNDSGLTACSSIAAYSTQPSFYFAEE